MTRSLEVKRVQQEPAETSFWNRSYLALRSSNPLVLVAASTLVITGLFLIFCAVERVLSPLWLASVATIMGSVSTLVGNFLFYEIFHKPDVRHDLFREAIRRVIENQN